jgi:hypothetical protein
MKSSLHRLIPFLSLSCNCQLSSVPLLSSSYFGRLASRNSTPFTELFFIATLHGPRRKHSLYIAGKACLQRRCSGSYAIVACIFVAARICLSRRCLAMNIYSDLPISTFGCHVTILICLSANEAEIVLNCVV